MAGQVTASSDSLNQLMMEDSSSMKKHCENAPWAVKFLIGKVL